MHRIIAYDSIRLDPAFFGIHPSIPLLLWQGCYTPIVGAIVTMACTWISFSSKDLLVRKALVNNFALYMTLMVAWIAATLTSIGAGFGFKYYNILFRLYCAICGTILLLLAGICLTYGIWALLEMEGVQEEFGQSQLRRVLVTMTTICTCCSVFVIVHGIKTTQVDNSLVWFQIFSNCYRLAGFTCVFGGGLYSWRHTSNWIRNHAHNMDLPSEGPLMTITSNTNKPITTESIIPEEQEAPRKPLASKEEAFADTSENKV